MYTHIDRLRFFILILLLSLARQIKAADAQTAPIHSKSNAATPRVAIGYYLTSSGANRLLSGTKVRASFAKGIKGPSIFQQNSSLLSWLAANPASVPLIDQYNIGQVGPETSRNYDGGLDQEFAHSRGRLGLTYFHNEFGNFGTIPIGSSGPLKGNCPFRARNSGCFGIQYGRSRFSTSLNATTVGLCDDSDFFTNDINGKPNLLLPNQNLDGAYQRPELSGNYHVTSYLTACTEIQNLLSQHYSEAFAYPALSLNFRVSIRVSPGGEAWRGHH